MPKKKTTKPSKPSPASAIINLAKQLEAYRNVLSRLAGIVNALPNQPDPSAVLHSLKSIRGYKKNTIRNAKAFLAAFDGVDELLAELE